MSTEIKGLTAKPGRLRDIRGVLDSGDRRWLRTEEGEVVSIRFSNELLESQHILQATFLSMAKQAFGLLTPSFLLLAPRPGLAVPCLSFEVFHLGLIVSCQGFQVISLCLITLRLRVFYSGDDEVAGDIELAMGREDGAGVFGLEDPVHESVCVGEASMLVRILTLLDGPRCR